MGHILAFVSESTFTLVKTKKYMLLFTPFDLLTSPITLSKMNLKTRKLAVIRILNTVQYIEMLLVYKLVWKTTQGNDSSMSEKLEEEVDYGS